MKKIIMLISILMLISFSDAKMVYDREGYENFPDVIGTKYEDAALYLKAFGYVSGYPDGTFRPENEIKRSELIRIAFEFSPDAKKKLDSLTEPLDNFSDVPMDHWAKQYIEVAAEVGIASGYGDGTFKPDKNVTHAEALTILMNLHGLKQTVNMLEPRWPNNYISYAFFNGFSDMSNSEDYYNPATRGDVAIYISNIRDINWK